MERSTWVISAALLLFGSSAAVMAQKHFGQAGEAACQSATKTPAPVTLALRARMTGIGRLDEAAAAALDAGDYAAAEDAARRSVSLGVQSGLGQELLARILFEQNKDREALQIYRTIAEQGANATRNEFPYALLLLKAGRWPQAVAAYDTALTLGGETGLLRQNAHFSPGVPQPRELEAAIRIGLGVTSLGAATPGDQRRNSLALAQLQRAIAMEPDSGLAHYYYGYALQQAGRRKEAQAAFAKAVEVGRGDVKAAAEQEMRFRYAPPIRP